MNDRRKLIVGLGASVLAAPLASFAQMNPAKVYRIGVLFVGTHAATARFDEAILQGLREHGFVEGQNVIVERRYGDGKVERMPDLATDLVRTMPDVIVATTDPSIAAVRNETQTIPVVMAVSYDPVGTGFVASLARPGGKLTGLSHMTPELSGKRLELLKEVVSGLARVAIMWNPDSVLGATYEYKETEVASRALRLQLQSVEVRRAEDLDRAFSAIADNGAQGLIVQIRNPVALQNLSRIVSFAQTNRLPTIGGISEFTDAGGLMSYGPNIVERYRRVAYYVERILKGAKPADLPIEQPTKFELVINLKTAKALGLTIPQTVLVRADRVIE